MVRAQRRNHARGNKSQDWSRTVPDIGIGYGADIKKAKEIMVEVGRAMDTDPEYGELVLETPEVLGAEDLGADSVVIRMVVSTNSRARSGPPRASCASAGKAAFDEGTSRSAPPAQRTVWGRDGDKPAGAGGGDDDAGTLECPVGGPAGCPMAWATGHGQPTDA